MINPQFLYQKRYFFFKFSLENYLLDVIISVITLTASVTLSDKINDGSKNGWNCLFHQNNWYYFLKSTKHAEIPWNSLTWKIVHHFHPNQTVIITLTFLSDQESFSLAVVSQWGMKDLDEMSSKVHFLEVLLRASHCHLFISILDKCLIVIQVTGHENQNWQY